MSMQDLKISYAQNREDIILEAMVRPVNQGVYVDIGANDPNKDSVTKRFYLNGWSGINIEPNKLLWERLEFDRPRDVNLCIGIAEKNGKLKFREYIEGNGLSTFSEDMKNENTDVGTYKDYEVAVKSLATVFKENAISTINFMKIDVEGFEWEVIQGNDWKKYRPEVLCIEANHSTRLQKWHDFFDSIGYTFVFFDGINEYYRDSHAGPWPVFSYPHAVLAQPVVTHEDYTLRSSQKAELAKCNQELNLMRIHIRHLWKEAEAKQHQINVINNEMQQMRRLKPAIKTLIKAVNTIVKTRIEGMNKPRLIDASLIPMESITAEESDTAGSLFKKIRLFDFKNNYKRHIPVSGAGKVAYRASNAGYGVVKRTAKAGIKGVRKVSRK